MATTTITALTGGTALGGTEVAPFDQGASTVKITATQIKTWTSASPTLVTPDIGVATGTSLAATGTLKSTQSIGAVSTDGAILTNVTAAAAGAQQYSPRLRLTGQGWKTTATAASQTVDWIAEVQPVQGTTAPTSLLSFSSQINGGGYSQRVYFDTAGGVACAAVGANVAPGAAGTITATSTISSSGGPVSGIGVFALGGTNGSASTSQVRIRGSGGSALLELIDSANSANSRICRVKNESGVFGFDYVNDAYNANATWLQSTGGSGGVTTIAFPTSCNVTSAASFLAHSGTAIPAGGASGKGLMVSRTSNFGVFFGSGAPSLAAAKGSLYLRSDGSTTNDRAYINTDGSTTWTALTTAA